MLQDVQEMRKVQIHKYKIYYFGIACLLNAITLIFLIILII